MCAYTKFVQNHHLKNELQMKIIQVKLHGEKNKSKKKDFIFAV